MLPRYWQPHGPRMGTTASFYPWQFECLTSYSDPTKILMIFRLGDILFGLRRNSNFKPAVE